MIGLLEMLKYYHDIGIYGNVVRNAKEISEDDYFEFAEYGLEFVAPDFAFEEISFDDNHDPVSEDEPESTYSDHVHSLYRFGSPEMREYYRLCRLYEHREHISPEENPFVRKADAHCSVCANAIPGYLWIGFDDVHTRELQVEICPDECFVSIDLIEAVHNILEYYGEHVSDIRLELGKGPPVFLPALPAPKGGNAHETQSGR
jgi:hypothetical protein